MKSSKMIVGVDTAKRVFQLYRVEPETGGEMNVRLSRAQFLKMNGVNPHASLKATLEAIAAGHPASDVDALMPWAFTPASS